MTVSVEARLDVIVLEESEVMHVVPRTSRR